MDDDPVVRRIERALGTPDLVDAVAALPGTDVTSLLLAVARRRAGSVSPAALPRSTPPGRAARAATTCARASGCGATPSTSPTGGFTDWCARLLGDRKERVLTSGIGLDRLAS